MPLTIVATAGSPTANSYADEAQFVAYAATKLFVPTGTTVSGATCTEREKAAQEATLAQQKFEFEAQLAERKMMFEAQLAEQQAARQHEIAMKSAEAKISQNRPGGSLAE